MTSLGRDSVRLPLVLSHTGVDGLYDIGTDRRLEDIRERGGRTAGLSVSADDRNSGSGRLFFFAKSVSTSPSPCHNFPPRSHRYLTIFVDYKNRGWVLVGEGCWYGWLGDVTLLVLRLWNVGHGAKSTPVDCHAHS